MEKNRFPSEYQRTVGPKAPKSLHRGSKNIINILKKYNVIQKENLIVCELGSGPARNLQYIYNENKSSKFYSNDLWERTVTELSKDMKELYENGSYEFTAMDSEEYVKSRVLNVDLFMTISHLMHVEYEKVEFILKRVRDEWKPSYIFISELREEFQNPEKPYLYHNYSLLEKSYDRIHYSRDVGGRVSKGFCSLYRLKK